MRPSVPDTSRRRVWSLAVILALAASVTCGLIGLIVLAGTASPAYADNTLVSSTPADGDVVPVSPTSLQLVFANPVSSANAVEAACNGTRVVLGAPQIGVTSSTLEVAVPTPLPRGECTISWKVLDSDGRPELGTFGFTIQSSPAQAVASATQPATPSTLANGADAVAAAPSGNAPQANASASAAADEAPNVGGPLAVSRIASSLGLAVLFGGLVLILVAWPEGVEYILTVRFLRAAWVVALAGTLGAVVFATARATGESVGSSLSPSAWLDFADTTPGKALVARLALAAACGWVVVRPERAIDPATQLAALALPGLAVATMGLSRGGGDLGAVGAAAGVLHALSMAVWLGGLVLLARVALSGPGDSDVVHAVRGFTKISVPALVLTVASGAVQTYRLDRGSLFGSGHGRVLLLKALVVGVMVFIGFAAREFVRMRLRRVDTINSSLAARVQRPLTMEALCGVVVLALSAWLLAQRPPNVDAGLPDVGDYAVSATLPEQATGFGLRLGLTPAVVGRNGVLVEVTEPEEGVSGLRVTFVPPDPTTVATVVLTVPLTGAGIAVLPTTEGIPLDAPGVWTVQVEANTDAGVTGGVVNVTVEPAGAEEPPS